MSPVSRREWSVLCTGLIVLSVLLGACSSGGGSTVPETPRIRQIKQQGKLIVGTALTPPFESRNEKGELVGYDVEIAKAIAAKIGVPIEWKEFAFSDLVPAQQAGNVDMVIAAMYITPARQEQVDMSEGYADTGLVIVTRADNAAITKAEDLAGKTVGVKQGATGAKYAAELKNKGINLAIQEYTETRDSLEDLSTKQVDAVLNDKINSIQYIKTHPELKIASDVLSPAQLGLAVKKGDADLLNVVNTSLKEFRTNGMLDKLYQQWIIGK